MRGHELSIDYPPFHYWPLVGIYREGLARLPRDLQEPLKNFELQYKNMLADALQYEWAMLPNGKFLPVFVPKDFIPSMGPIILLWNRWNKDDRKTTNLETDNVSEDVFLLSSFKQIICVVPYRELGAKARGLVYIPFAAEQPISPMRLLTWFSALDYAKQKNLTVREIIESNIVSSPVPLSTFREYARPKAT